MINYYLITKPGIIFGNLLTVAAGFLLASRGNIHWFLFLATLVGLALIMASACIFNNYIDRHIDKKMERTKNRALASGLISPVSALLLASVLGVCGVITLFVFTNALSVGVATLGFFVYVVLYSVWKSRTIYGTAIGSVAGATPPVVGYCAVSGQLDAGAWILLAMLILWQMPHFFSIAVYRLQDYAAAGIPVLPIERGMHRTKVHMTFYILAFLGTAALPTAVGYTGYLYLVVTGTIGLIWLGLCLNGFRRSDDASWGREMFYVSLILILAICTVIPFELSILSL